MGTNRKLEKFLYACRSIQSDIQTDCRFLPLLKVRFRFSYVQYKLPGIWLEVEHDLNAFYSSNLFFLFVYVTILEPVALRSALRYINVIQTLALRIGHFWDASNLCFKVSAKPFIWKCFYSHANKTHFHSKVRAFVTRKWRILTCLCFPLSRFPGYQSHWNFISRLHLSAIRRCLSDQYSVQHSRGKCKRR